MRAKLYRFASENDPPEWKERGTGDVKLLKHKEKGTIRLLMRRDRTLKICANHNIAPLMELRPNAGSDRAWVWNTHADFADEHPKPEMLAIRFLNAENAQKFKAKFDECKEEVRKSSGNYGCLELGCFSEPLQTHSVPGSFLLPGAFSVCYIELQDVTNHLPFLTGNCPCRLEQPIVCN
ncbi:RANG protein, partial [Amia calva]|nr:RANG protein [Amia calva]